MNKLRITFLIMSLLVAGWVFGLTNSEIELCFSNSKLDKYCEKRGDDACREILKQCEQYLGEVQAQYEEDLERTEAEKRNLANQIANLENRMEQLDYQIRQSEIRIKDLGYQIASTQESITRMNAKIEDHHEQLEEILKLIEKEDRRSLLEILVVDQNLSDFFNNLTALERLSKESQSILNEVRDLRNSLETTEQRLAREKEEAQRQAEIHALQRQESAAARQEQEYLYDLTEEEYQQQLSQKEIIEERAQEIMNRRLTLVGLPESEIPSFGEALEIARWAENITGIRPAFLLAIITQESALGRNVGECYLREPSTGAGIRISTGANVPNLMATPPNSYRNDAEKFLQITEMLDLDPYSTPVSCPFQVGYGGAMGPAQFIPTTWWNQRPQLVSILGREPNPWKLQDSFLASATYLANLGGIYNERTAALRYYAGSNWNNPRHAFYGDQVVRRIECLQTFIDDGTMSASCSNLVFIPE